jgi:hypothetical protein
MMGENLKAFIIYVIKILSELMRINFILSKLGKYWHKISSFPID